MPNKSQTKQEYEAIYSFILSRIKTFKKERGIGNELIGDAMGYSQQQISKIILGRNHLRAASLFQLAKESGVPISYFFPPQDKEGKFEIKNLKKLMTDKENLKALENAGSVNQLINIIKND